MTSNLEAKEDLETIEKQVKALHFHQLQTMLALKEISKISPSLARSYCASHIAADCLRKVEISKLMTLAGSSKPSMPLLKLNLDPSHLKVIDEMAGQLSKATLGHASEYLSIQR